MRSAVLAVLAAALISLPVVATAADSLAVEVVNGSEPVLCAEKDNVTVSFASPEVRRFRVEAAHPVYIGGLRQDRWAPDWTNCTDISAETSSAGPPPRKTTLYESVDAWLTGYHFANFWRPSATRFRVGDRVESGLHLVQLWVRRDERAEEVLAFYPADGYWRIRPLPPQHLGWSAYGSSFLIGPVADEGRPVVNISEVAFDPATLTFRLAFADGSDATVRLDKLDRERLSLDVQLGRAVAGKPFAAMRSMYVTEFNADVARVALREAGAKGWTEAPILGFTRARAHEVWLGRLAPSHHNTSAPDLVFNAFRGAPAATR